MQRCFGTTQGTVSKCWAARVRLGSSRGPWMALENVVLAIEMSTCTPRSSVWLRNLSFRSVDAGSVYFYGNSGLRTFAQDMLRGVYTG